MKPVFRANGHEKRGFEWSTFSLKLKNFYSKVGGYAPEYVRTSTFEKDVYLRKAEQCYLPVKMMVNNLDPKELTIPN